MMARGNNARVRGNGFSMHGCNGQAIVEFLISLVAILVLAGGLLQLTALMAAQSRTMVQARKEAGVAAVQQVAELSDPEFIKDWQAGNDAVTYTADDVAEASDAGDEFENLFVEKASTAGGWPYIEQSSSDKISPMRTLADPSACFGLVDGHHEEDVQLLPAVRSLLYDKESILVESKVWMTFCGGIY